MQDAEGWGWQGEVPGKGSGVVRVFTAPGDVVLWGTPLGRVGVCLRDGSARVTGLCVSTLDKKRSYL